jgi:diaminohydroxyphosphoribosylaminopyrimidine deaminase/5-amino-6-(5-phosphoribosylamino)uracil reductase
MHVQDGRTPERLMRRALDLAWRGLGRTSPNPMVGAVLAHGEEIVGEGWHEGPGTAHAERMALDAAGDRARGATLHVTLEPCSHHGRTPPCAPAVAAAGVTRVVAAIGDPNPLVDGRGFAMLAAGGVDVIEGVLAEEVSDLVRGFARHVRTGLPYVVLKAATSLDGKAAASDGSARWITGQEARADGHRLRARSGAVVVGAGTALSDAPALTVRLPGYAGRQPMRVLVDAAGHTPPVGPLFDDAAPTLVATTTRASEHAVTAWKEAGARVTAYEPAEDGRVPLAWLVRNLGEEGIQEVLVEGGPTLGWAFVEAGLVDRVVLYTAAKLIGGAGAPGALGGAGVRSVTDAIPLSLRSVDRLGDDLRVEADVHRDR